MSGQWITIDPDKNAVIVIFTYFPQLSSKLEGSLDILDIIKSVYSYML